jgi:hypothetical protein
MTMSQRASATFVAIQGEGMNIIKFSNRIRSLSDSVHNQRVATNYVPSFTELSSHKKTHSHPSIGLLGV